MLPFLRLIYRAWKYRIKSDPAEIRTLLRSLSSGDLALDIGCHKGGYLYWMRQRVGYEGRVIGFEPQPVLADRLREIITIAGWRNVTVHNAGVSSTDGEMTLTVPISASGASPGATLEKIVKPGEETRSVAVKTVRLDTILPVGRSTQKVAFIKCDVEGHELEVFRGGEQLLRREAPVLMFECEMRHHANGEIEGVFEFLRGLDYQGSFFGVEGKLRPMEEFDAKSMQIVGKSPYFNNFLFKKKNRS
jgi:FkbM family methyltransferase